MPLSVPAVFFYIFTAARMLSRWSGGLLTCLVRKFAMRALHWPTAAESFPTTAFHGWTFGVLSILALLYLGK